MKKRQGMNANGGNAKNSPSRAIPAETLVSGISGAGISERIVRLRIVCRAPPDPERHGATFGLQDNSTAAAWAIHPGTQKANGDLHFECEVRVRPNKRTGGPNFLGDFVHGPTEKRFLYLSWRPEVWRLRKPEPSSPCWTRRMKIHLSTITWELIERATQLGGVMEATVEGTGKDGGPSCASVPLLGDGWTVGKS